MGNFAIDSCDLGKLYHIGKAKEQQEEIARILLRATFGPFRRAFNIIRGQGYGAAELTDTIWALRHINFQVKHGEVVGIIGRNGAGKSTLLKILSRITKPTEGYVDVYGRVGSLLEVGTGFHQELTGRENVYMNGSILGMSNREIASKFDEIVEFSGVGKFVDTPVKHYSSGMRVRLGFAVAAHLDPDILIVDEVLSVGDFEFQQKCLNRMEHVSNEGRTVLMVSHNLGSITRLCQRVILLEDGELAMDDRMHEVVGYYVGGNEGIMPERVWDDPEDAPGSDHVKLRAVRVVAEYGEISGVFDIRKPIKVEIEYDVLQPGLPWTPSIMVLNDRGDRIFISGPYAYDQVNGQDLEFVGRRKATCIIPGNLMVEGFFTIDVSLITLPGKRERHAFVDSALRFQIFDPAEGDSARGVHNADLRGMIRPLLAWTDEAARLEALPQTR